MAGLPGLAAIRKIAWPEDAQGISPVSSARRAASQPIVASGWPVLLLVPAVMVRRKAGPVEISVPRDRDSSFEPKIVARRQRRLTGVDDMVISLPARGLTHGEIAAHLAEVYGAEVSKQAISTITGRVTDGMADWQSRPLDPVYAVIFIDASNVKIRGGQVANLDSRRVV